MVVAGYVVVVSVGVVSVEVVSVVVDSVLVVGNSELSERPPSELLESSVEPDLPFEEGVRSLLSSCLAPAPVPVEPSRSDPTGERNSLETRDVSETLLMCRSPVRGCAPDEARQSRSGAAGDAASTTGLAAGREAGRAARGA